VLLRTSNRREHDSARSTPWWKRLGTLYVTAVLTIAVGGFAGWLLVTHDLARSLDVVAALLIVTCPCAFGIATPLAYELAQASLRRVGLFVRTPGFLDRAADIRRVVFDKTGTLTTGALAVENPAVLSGLTREERALAYDLAVRSSHPKSFAIVRSLLLLGVAGSIDTRREVREVAGKGLETTLDGQVWRLGAPAWATEAASPASPAVAADVVFSRDGEVLAAVMTGETLRADASVEVRELEREGYEPCVLSGDSLEATRAIAAACGIPRDRAFGARTPEGKAAWLRALGATDGRPALFVGDGINDSLVAEQASCAGTPAIDRPFMAARCDFYFVSPGLGPIRAALHMAKRLARVVRRNLVIATFYNVITVTLALAGLMTPLWCAVLMPLSSLSTVLATTWQLRTGKTTTWTS
jgi:Cu2+-exporting ATPase